MAVTRRRIIRFPETPARNGTHPQRQREKLRARLQEQRKALVRWLGRLKRAFHAFEKIHTAIGRLERRIAKLHEED